MSINRIASRYAKSLLDLALEQNALEAVKEDMQAIRKLTREYAEFASFLRSPVIQYTKKQQVFAAIGRNFNPLTLQFINLLASKQREAYLAAISDEFMVQYRTHHHISTVSIISAAPLTPALLSAIQQKLELSPIGFANVEVSTRIDPSLIGGFVVEYEGRVYDVSLKHQLDALRKQFATNLYETQVGR